jgi:hypothetical protein
VNYSTRTEFDQLIKKIKRVGCCAAAPSLRPTIIYICAKAIRQVSRHDQSYELLREALSYGVQVEVISRIRLPIRAPSAVASLALTLSRLKDSDPTLAPCLLLRVEDQMSIGERCR